MKQAIQEDDLVRYSDTYLQRCSLPKTAIKRRGIAGKSKTYPTKIVYREVLWEDLNRIDEIDESWLEKA